MKIGLLGNMNNNNFAVMRYFRELGMDAHLLLYKDDGKNKLEHFTPEADTWSYESWAPFIHKSPIANTFSYAFNEPFIWIFNLHQFITSTIRRRAPIYVSSTKKIRNYLSEYDILIGSGIAPAVCHRIGRRLDIFAPYSIGVEHIATKFLLAFMKKTNFVNRGILKRTANLQAKGIKSSKYVLNVETCDTEQVLKEIGANPIRLAIPMCFNNEISQDLTGNGQIDNALAEVKNRHPSFIAPSRLFWCKPESYSDQDWLYENKRNDIFFKGFAAALRSNSTLQGALILVPEYGPDIEQTKILCESLGITENVRWVPRQSRKILSLMVSRVDVVVGEFYDVENMVWGGVGWEAFAAGKPLIHGYQFRDSIYQDTYGHPPPNILKANTELEVTTQILHVVNSPDRVAQEGRENIEWFNAHGGVGLASRWLKLLIS